MARVGGTALGPSHTSKPVVLALFSRAKARVGVTVLVTHPIACFLSCLAGPVAKARCVCLGHITHLIACCSRLV